MSSLYTSEVLEARSALIEAVERSVAGSRLTLDQAEGQLSGLVCDLWTMLERRLRSNRQESNGRTDAPLSRRVRRAGCVRASAPLAMAAEPMAEAAPVEDEAQPPAPEVAPAMQQVDREAEAGTAEQSLIAALRCSFEQS